jgi:hypothetical protein
VPQRLVQRQRPRGQRTARRRRHQRRLSRRERGGWRRDTRLPVADNGVHPMSASNGSLLSSSSLVDAWPRFGGSVTSGGDDLYTVRGMQEVKCRALRVRAGRAVAVAGHRRVARTRPLRTDGAVRRRSRRRRAPAAAARSRSRACAAVAALPPASANCARRRDSRGST